MSTNERLGIQLYFDLKELDANLSQIKSKLQNTFGDLSKLVDVTKINDTFKATTTQVELLNKAWGTTTAKTKERLKEMFDIEQVQKYVQKDLDITKKGLNEKTAATKKAAEDQQKVNDQVFKARLRQLSEEEKQLNTSLRAYAKYQEAREAAFKKSENKQALAEEAAFQNRIWAEYKASVNYANKIFKDAAAERKRVLRDESNNRKAQAKADADEEAAIVKRAWAEHAASVNYANQVFSASNKAGKVTGGPVSTQWSKDIETQAKQAEAFLQGLGRQGFKYVNGAIVEATQSMKGFNGGLLNLLNLEARFYSVRAILFAMTTQIRDSISSVLDLNQALHDTAAISGASVEEMQRLERVALNLAASSKFTAQGIMDVMKTLAQAGVNANQMPDVTKATVMFATGAGATPDQAVKLMTTSLNAFEIEAKDSMRVANALTAALNSSKLEAGGLGTAFNYIANEASAMGMSLEESLGIVSAISQKGIMSSTIGTGMSQLLSNLVAPKGRFSALLEKRGVNLDAINPAKNSFADVVKELEKADFTLQEIQSSLDKRVARALVTTLNVGSDGFRRMTEAVTGTNATLIANMKAMEGVRNQMNVVKQEFVIAVNDIGKILSGPLAAAFGLLRTFVAGLNTDGGKFVLALSAISVAAMALIPMIVNLTKTIQALGLATAIFTKLNPWVAALTLGLGAASAAITLFGASQRRSKKELEDYTSQIGKTADKIKQAEDSMNSFVLSITATGVSKVTYNQLTVEQRKALDDLIKNHPEYLSGLNKEKDLLDQINEAQDKVIENKRIGARIGVNSYNFYGDLLKKAETNASNLESELAGAPKETRARNRYFNKLGEKYNDDPTTALKKMKEYIETVKQWQSLSASQAGTFGQVDPMTGLMSFNDDFSSKKKGKIEPGDAVTNAAKERQKELEKAKEEAAKNYLDYLKDVQKNKDKFLSEVEKLEYSTQEREANARIKALEDVLTDTTKTYEEKQSAFEEAKLEIRKKVEAKYSDDRKSIVEGFLSAGATDDLFDDYTKALENLDKKIDADISSEANPLGYKLNKKSGLTSDYYEKQAERRFRTEAQALNLQKEQAKTAEEIRNLDIQILQAQIDSGDMKVKSYQNDLKVLGLSEESVRKKQEEGVELSENERRYINIRDKMEEIVNLNSQLLKQQTELKDTSFGTNFKKGMYKANRGFGDAASMTEDLGYNITNTLETSTESAVNGMIDALGKGENAWRSFKDGIGNILKDIADVLQKYIVKMMVVYAVQQLIGMATASSGGGGSPMTSSTSAGTFTLGANGLSPAQFADGGVVTGGIPGKDSVPILAMPKEFIVRASAVDKYGVDFMQELNAGRVKRFAAGGSVSGVSASASSGKSEQPWVLNIYNIADIESVPRTTGPEIINTVSFSLSKRDVLYRQIKGIMQGN